MPFHRNNGNICERIQVSLNTFLLTRMEEHLARTHQSKSPYIAALIEADLAAAAARDRAKALRDDLVSGTGNPGPQTCPLLDENVSQRVRP